MILSRIDSSTEQYIPGATLGAFLQPVINKFIVQGPMALIRPLSSVHNDFYDLPPPINQERFIPTKRGQCDHDLLDWVWSAKAIRSHPLSSTFLRGKLWYKWRPGWSLRPKDKDRISIPPLPLTRLPYLFSELPAATWIIAKGQERLESHVRDAVSENPLTEREKSRGGYGSLGPWESKTMG